MLAERRGFEPRNQLPSYYLSKHVASKKTNSLSVPYSPVYKTLLNISFKYKQKKFICDETCDESSLWVFVCMFLFMCSS